jgi:hypothetical protein
MSTYQRLILIFGKTELLDKYVRDESTSREVDLLVWVAYAAVVLVPVELLQKTF